MSRYFSIEKVPFTSALLGLAAIAHLGFVTYRPNRIAAGKLVFLWQIHGDLWIVILTLWATMVILSVLNFRQRRPLLFTILSSVQLLLLIAAAGKHAAFTAREAGSIARISLGAAFWTSLFLLIIVQLDTLQKTRKMKNIMILIVILSCAMALWMLFSGWLDSLSILREFSNRRERFYHEVAMHLMLAGSSVGIALALGVPLGLIAHRSKRLYGTIFFILNTLQTMPSLALFGILIPLIAAVTLKFPFLTELGIKGIGAAPAIIALTAYSLLPVARNTYTGFATVDPAAVEAGTGMGMTRIQLLMRVEIPIALPVILNGIRVALIQAVGLTAVAALIGAGGLGVFIFQGLGQAADDLILLGAIPTILIAVVLDSMMNGMIHVLQPKGFR